ncbi:unnamed protein product [Rhizophagus irregularis]|nr:unnamed protein product [Rhizophagus irregularis]
MNLITPKERRFLKLEEVIPKVEELKSILKKCGEEMEWEAIKENLRMIVIQYRQKFTTLNNDFTKKVKEEEQKFNNVVIVVILFFDFRFQKVTGLESRGRV